MRRPGAAVLFPTVLTLTRYPSTPQEPTQSLERFTSSRLSRRAAGQLRRVTGTRRPMKLSSNAPPYARRMTEYSAGA
jgi:hypothetical protein